MVKKKEPDPPNISIEELWMKYTNPQSRNATVLADTMYLNHGVKKQDALEVMWRMIREHKLELTADRRIRRVSKD